MYFSTEQPFILTGALICKTHSDQFVMLRYCDMLLRIKGVAENLIMNEEDFPK